MSFADEISKSQEAEGRWRRKQSSKIGEYVDIDCPNCDRHRVMAGSDGKKRCEKCFWCIGDNNYDSDFRSYMNNSR